MTGLLPGEWTPGSEHEFVLDLGNLPNGDGTFTNLLTAMRQNRFLDLYVNDDTGVDYVVLEIRRDHRLDDIVLVRDAGQCGAVVNYAPLFADDCDPSPTVICTPPSGSFFPVGTNTEVICVGTDLGGNSSSRAFSVYVDDPDRPALAIVKQGSNVVLSWPDTSSCTYVLEEANFLSQNFPGLWRRNLTSVTHTGGRYSVVLPIQSSNRFFRLRTE
jgi:hypothetical protein